MACFTTCEETFLITQSIKHGDALKSIFHGLIHDKNVGSIITLHITSFRCRWTSLHTFLLMKQITSLKLILDVKPHLIPEYSVPL